MSMADDKSEAEGALDAITAEEIAGTAARPSQREAKNAFAELMSPKKPQHSSPGANTAKPPGRGNLNAATGWGALKAYTDSPTSFSSSRVISYDDNFVVINDLFPKSQLHLLLLPRNPSKQLLHPFESLNGDDAAFLAMVKAETARVRRLAASELRRRFGRFSAAEASRNAALDADELPAEADLPPGRDWEASIISGVHAHPSMEHLHIHVLSVDRVSECMKHRKHYNSFATPFLVPIEDFPLAPDDPRRHPGRAGYLERDLKCWRCGRSFKNKFQQLKSHLDEEFEAWKRE